jgi:hypothetical protein
LPSRFRRIIGPLSEHDVVVADLFIDQALRVGCDLLVASHRVRGRKGRDNVGIAALKIPEVVQVSIGQNHESAVLGFCVFSSLFFADEWVLIFRLCLKYDERESLGVEKQEIDEALVCLLEVVPECVEVG